MSKYIDADLLLQKYPNCRGLKIKLDKAPAVCGNCEYCAHWKPIDDGFPNVCELWIAQTPSTGFCYHFEKTE